MSGRLLVLLFLMVTVFSSTSLIQAIDLNNLEPDYWREYVGRETQTSWVPIMIVYDPPGDGSYAKVTQQSTHRTGISYDGIIPGYDASGEHTYEWTITTSYKTPDNKREHRILTYKFEQVWDVYSTITRTGVYYSAHHVSSTYADGIGWLSPSDCEDEDIIVTSLIGTQGNYRYHRLVSPASQMSESITYTWGYDNDFGLGYTVTLKGHKFNIAVRIIDQLEHDFTLENVYYDSDDHLDFYLESDVELVDNNDGSTIDGITVWFNQ